MRKNMSEQAGMTIEEAEEVGELTLLGTDAENHGEAPDRLEGAPEDLMTDMKLEDEIDELRVTEPDFQWLYHIEIYPWNADDMTENFVRLLKLADFTQIFIRKKGACKETRNQESMDDKLHDRQRKGSIHLYTDSFQNAKLIIRSSTWKAMISKQLTFEITRREPGSNVIESAYLEVDTYTACKCRYRDRPKGEFKDRTAKVSCIPGGISREFLDVVLCRAIPVMGGSSLKEYYEERDSKLHQKLSQIEAFNGSLDFDCLTKASCRAFVTAHKNVYIEGQRISITANSKETMTAPPPAPYVAPSSINYAAMIANQSLWTPAGPEPLQANSDTNTKLQQQVSQGTLAQQATFRGNQASHVSVAGRGGLMKEPSNFTVWGRGRGIGRSTLLTQRPANNAISRSGPGMPVPMTGRQKMNEKLRRNNLGISPGPPVSCSMSNSQGGLSVPRSAISSSLGESFKQEIALLQKQLQQNTAELEAKIAMLRESTHSAALYEEWDEDWEDSAFGDTDGHSQVNFVSGDDAGCTTYPLCFDHMANQPALPRSDSQLSSDVQGQTRPKGLAVGTHETVARQMAAPYGDFGQTPMSHVAIIPAQLSQTVPRLIPQLLSEQMPQAMTGQMSQAISGQMPQAMPGQMSHAMPGQMPQAMSEQRLQFAPVQLAQALLDQMAQVLPAQLKPGNHRHLGGMHGPPPGQAHFHRGGSRGGGYYQKTRGSLRGRGKSMSGSDGWN